MDAPATSLENELDVYVQALLEKKAFNISILDLRGLTSIADAFILCSGRSNRQVSAIAEHIHTTLKKKGIYPLNVEGTKEGHWVLIDYGHVIIHVFFEPIREFYDLESLWQDAKLITPPSLLKPASVQTEKEPTHEF